LRCDRRAPRLARRAVESALERAPLLDDARLVTTELVNHAVLHSGCVADDIIRVMVRLDPGFLIISVHDPGRSNEAPWRHPRDHSEPGAFALQIVEEIADRWGAEHPGAHHVWAALPLSKTHAPPCDGGRPPEPCAVPIGTSRVVFRHRTLPCPVLRPNCTPFQP
jgi:hypothetical protein